MKKIVLAFLPVMLMTACEKNLAPADQVQETSSTTAGKGAPVKIDVCHFDAKKNSWKMLTINLSQWPDHQAHGDVRLDDADGDNYVPTNYCSLGQMGDCDDNNAAVYPGATEIVGNGIDENCNGMVDDVPAIGNIYQGGIVAYILQPGDPGYIAGEIHGLIAAPNDQSVAAIWDLNPLLTIGGTSTELGTGSANTVRIIAVSGIDYSAAALCGNLVLNGYDDWFLPSKDELHKLYINQNAIGGFRTSGYWSSSEMPSGMAWYQEFGFDYASNWQKNYERYVRACRSF